MSGTTHQLHVLGGLDSLSGPDALERLRQTSPAAFTIIAQWQALRAEIEEAKSRQQKQWVLARKLQGSYDLPDRITLEQIYARLRSQIRKARHDLVALYKEYLPTDLCRQVTPQLRDLDPVHLVEFGLPAQNGQLRLAFDRMEFEARQALLLGLLFFDITAERWSNRDPVGDLQELTQFLVDERILVGQPQMKDLVSWHDPAREFCCVAIEEFQDPVSRTGLKRVVTKFLIAHLKVNGGSPIPIVYKVRRKLPLSLIRRMLVDGEWDPQRVRDLRAFRFGYFSEENLLHAYPSVSQRLMPGSAGQLKDRYNPGTVNPNRHSSPEFRGIAHQARILGRVYQVDHMLAQTWLNIEHAKGEINHDRYHARQMYETDPPGLFLCVAPTRVYGADWTSQGVRARIDKHILASHH